MENSETTLRVTLYGETILREKGQPVQAFDAELHQLAKDMLATMYEHEGIGLAAQQVGKALMFCVVDLQVPPGERIEFTFTLDGKTLPIDLIMPLELANPVVEPITDDERPYDEGCLSFPDIRGEVMRPERIRVTYQDLNGAKHVLETGGLLARVILHEVDHLNGVLFIDRMNKDVYRVIRSRVNKLERKVKLAVQSGKLR